MTEWISYKKAAALRAEVAKYQAVKAERDRFREALESVRNVGDRAAVLVADAALAATTEAGDGRCPKCGMLEVCDDPECPEAGDEQ